jgi:hypothetical protein
MAVPTLLCTRARPHVQAEGEREQQTWFAEEVPRLARGQAVPEFPVGWAVSKRYPYAKLCVAAQRCHLCNVATTNHYGGLTKRQLAAN